MFSLNMACRSRNIFLHFLKKETHKIVLVYMILLYVIIGSEHNGDVWSKEPQNYVHILIIKPTRCTNFSNLFLE